MSDRKRKYMPYRENRMKAGILYQDFIVDLAWKQGLIISLYSSEEYQKGIGESRTGAEIKYDERYQETGNIYIETAEKAYPRDGDYVPSGIYANNNTWLYIIGNYNIVFVFMKSTLILLDKGNRYERKEIATSKGFIIPDNEAKKYAGVIWHPNSKENIKDMIDDLAAKGRELHRLATQIHNQLTLFP